MVLNLTVLPTPVSHIRVFYYNTVHTVVSGVGSVDKVVGSTVHNLKKRKYLYRTDRKDSPGSIYTQSVLEPVY